MISGHILRTVSDLPHVEEPVMKGHPSCRDTFLSDIKVSLEDRFYCIGNYRLGNRQGRQSLEGPWRG